MDHSQGRRNSAGRPVSAGACTSSKAARRRKQGACGQPAVAERKISKDEGLAGLLDLSQLSGSDRERVLRVVRQAEEAERRASDHSRLLKEQQLALVSRSEGSYQGLCPLCCQSLEGIRSRVCRVCDCVACQRCSTLLRHADSSRLELEVICKLCTLNRQIFLTSNEWREEGEEITFEDITLSPGYGMMLVCGMKCDGGILRTFVAEAPVGGAASKSGILEGDEVVLWCDQNVIGRSYRNVSDIVRKSCHGRISMTIRRYARGKEEEQDLWVNRQAADSMESDALAQRMLIDPVMVGYPEGIFQSIGRSKAPLYQNGRIKLRLNIERNDLVVSVVEAERLPLLKEGVPNSPAVHVSLNGQSSISTKQYTRNNKPAWHEELLFNAPLDLSSSLLRVSVKTPKQLFGKAILGECVIKLGEAKLTNSTEWYSLRAASSSSAVHYCPPRPTEHMRKAMVDTHRRKAHQSRRASWLGGSQPDLRSSEIEIVSGSVCQPDPIWSPNDRSLTSKRGSAKSPPSPLVGLQSRRTSATPPGISFCSSDGDVPSPRKKSSSIPRNSRALSPLAMLPLSIIAGISELPETRVRAATLDSRSHHHRRGMSVPSSLPVPRPLYGSTLRQRSMGSDSELSSACPSPSVTHRRHDRRGSLDSSSRLEECPPKEAMLPLPLHLRDDDDGETSSGVDECSPQSPTSGNGASHKRQQFKSGHRPKSVSYADETRPPAFLNEVPLSPAKIRSQSCADSATDGSPRIIHSLRSFHSVPEKASPPVGRTPRTSGNEFMSPSRRRKRFTEAFGTAGFFFSGCSDNDSVLSSFSEFSGSDYMQSESSSRLDPSDGALKGTSVNLTFTCVGRKLLLDIVRVNNFIGVAEDENLKLATLTGVGVKVTLLNVSGGREKHKTRLQPLSNCIEFDQQFPFDVSTGLNHYTFKLQLIAKMKRRTHLTRGKLLVVAYRLIPLQDVELQVDASHSETFKVFGKSQRVTADSDSAH